MSADSDTRKPPTTSIELTFDDTLETAVRAEWEALRRLGLSSMAAHTAPSNRPHVTLLARRSVEPFDADDLAQRLPLPIVLGTPVLFGTGERRVLARVVVPTRDLLALHDSLHERVGDGEDLPHTTAGEWLPHVTLARRLRLDQVALALALLSDELRGSVAGLRRWDSAPQLVTDLAAPVEETVAGSLNEGLRSRERIEAAPPDPRRSGGAKGGNVCG